MDELPWFQAACLGECPEAMRDGLSIARSKAMLALPANALLACLDLDDKIGSAETGLSVADLRVLVGKAKAHAKADRQKYPDLPGPKHIAHAQ